jgi:hypothetical protein
MFRVVVGPSRPSVSPGTVPLSLPGPTARNRPIPDSEIVARKTFAMQISGFAGAPGPNPFLLTPFGFYVNGNPYEMMRVDTRLTVGTSEEWTVTNPSSVAHAWHLHTVSFIVTEVRSMAPGSRNVLSQPYWADTVYIPANHLAVTRVRAVEHFGGTVAHCHMLNHEEQGLMINVLFVEPGKRDAPLTEGQLQLVDKEGGGHHGSAAGVMAGTSLRHRVSNKTTTPFGWPLPEPYLFQGEEAAAHPVATMHSHSGMMMMMGGGEGEAEGEKEGLHHRHGG